MGSRRSLVGRAVLWTAVLLVIGGGAASAQIPAGTFVVGFDGEPLGLDPAATTDVFALRITSQILENLVGEDVARAGVSAPPLVPGLAEKWAVSKDGLVYTFSLRHDVKFHDGTPFNAAAVVANFDRYLNPSISSSSPQVRTTTNNATRWIAAYRAVDDATFEVKLKEPFGSFLRSMAHRNFGLVSPTALQRLGAEGIARQPVGTGPFRLVEFARGQHVILAGDPSYWGEKARADRVVFRFIPDHAVRLAALRRGEIHLNMWVAPDNVREIQNDPMLTLVFPDPAHLWFLAFNYKKAPFTDVRVRQAINHALDRATIVQTVYANGAARLSQGIVPVGNPAHRNDMRYPYAQDVARAEKLLVDAGFPDGLPMAIDYPITGGSFMDSGPICSIMQEQLRRVKVRVECRPHEYGTYVSSVVKGVTNTQDAVVVAWTSIAVDPYMLEQLFHSANHPPKGNNWWWYGNPKVDGVLAEARRAADERTRLRLYQEAEDLILADAPAVFLAQGRFPRAYSKRVEGLTMGPSLWFDFRRVTVR